MSIDVRVPETAHQSIDQRDLRNAFSQFATGVTVITTTDLDGRSYGLTANSFSSVSMDPALLLFCPSKTIASLPVLERSGHFTVNILRANQQGLARQFARPSEDKFAGVDYSMGIFGDPVLGGCLATFQCSLYSNHDAGDHRVLIGQVHEFSYHPEHEALLFHQGQMSGSQS
ncbi:hypothetical protein CIK76_15905 [Glutamicibacter sp. BW80]|uniref:flavin reductase family protein n=1 Tax=unclassified Glutamicibacter TaxID=2627139 RepID=UPI000BB7918B|nr:flavin reductase family protein [Glutamicibacter sp. BW80]PCC27673.1 hypothetical protein CIK76_15905 [Glutamicibacter sp. BW80]